MAVVIDYKKCCYKQNQCVGERCSEKCDVCVEACPVGAIVKKDRIIINHNKCNDCGACVVICKLYAIKYVKY